jgi:zinc protease
MSRAPHPIMRCTRIHFYPRPLTSLAGVLAIWALWGAACVTSTRGADRARPPHPHRDLPTPDRDWNFRIPPHGIELRNGMRAVLIPDWSSELVEVGVRYDVGSIHDPPGRAGLAHLVEHLMFEQRSGVPGTPTVGAELDDVAVFHNAFTTWDSTHYLAMTTPDKLDRLIAIEARRLTTTCDQIDEKIVAREREIVRQELRQRKESLAVRVLPLLLRAAYPDTHPYRRSDFEQSEKELASISKADVCGFIERHYVVGNAVVVISGSVSRSDVERVLDKHLGGLKPRPGPARTELPAVTLEGKRTDHKLDVEDATLFVMWPMAPRHGERGLVSKLALTRLAMEVSEINDEDPFAHSIVPTSLGGMRAPMGMLSIALKRPEDSDIALAAVAKAATALDKDWDEDWASAMRISSYLQLLSAIEPLQMRTWFYGDYVQFDPSLRLLTGDMERMEALTADELVAASKQFSSLDRAAIVLVEPDAKARARHHRPPLTYEPASHDAGSSRAHVDAGEAMRPLAMDAPRSSMDKAISFELGNGLRVIMLRTYFSPVVHLDLIMDSGNAHESLPGLASNAAELLGSPGKGKKGKSKKKDKGKEGARPERASLDEQPWRSPYEQASGWLKGVATDRDVSVTDDQTHFRVTVLNPIYDYAIHGLAQWIQAGEYDQDDIDEMRKTFERVAARDRVRRVRRVATAVYRAMFGAEHPYARLGLPTAESIAKIDRDALQEFRRRHYVPNNATLIVTGQFVPEVAEAQIRAAFSSWRPGQPVPPIKAQPVARKAPLNLSGAGEPDDPLVAVWVGYTSPASVDERYGARLVLAEMLDSRVSAVRQVLAASYGMNAAFHAKKGPGYYSVSGSVDADRAGEALVAIRKGVQSLREGKDLAAEFAVARKRVVQRLLARLTNRDTMASQLAFLARHRLPRAYMIDLARDVARLTPRDIETLIAAELPPDREVVVCIGDRAKVADAYRSAGLSASPVE